MRREAPFSNTPSFLFTNACLAQAFFYPCVFLWTHARKQKGRREAGLASITQSSGLLGGMRDTPTFPRDSFAWEQLARSITGRSAGIELAIGAAVASVMFGIGRFRSIFDITERLGRGIGFGNMRQIISARDARQSAYQHRRRSTTGSKLEETTA
jgi:hypothetical protein